MDGILNVYKEKGYTSFDVVAILRKILHTKKIGHTGTLDPDAEGVLPVCVGKATKVCDMLTDSNKQYRAVMRLGVRTDTQDMSGTILEKSEVTLTEAEIRECISGFVGDIMQIPPMYSALKVGGQKLCDLARKGITVERAARPVTIFDICIEKIEMPLVTMLVSCSKGTYIRTLCDDIGEKLGCHAAMESLIRTKAAGFDISKALKLDEIREIEDFSGIIVDIAEVFAEYPALHVTDGGERLLNNGNALSCDSFKEDGNIDYSYKGYRVYNTRKIFCGVYEWHEENRLFKPVKMFYIPSRDDV